MKRTFFEGKTFKGADFTHKGFTTGEYEDCVFDHCIFTNADLSANSFATCEFVDCDLSNAKITNTAFQDIKFKGCKLFGLCFDQCNEFLFAVDFENCRLNLSSFYQRSLKRSHFKDCNLQEVDFVEADATKSIFDHCDMGGAIFQNTVLIEADLRTSFNFSIDPEINPIRKAKFSKMGISGLLDKYDIIVE